jgi:hypothetical protein
MYSESAQLLVAYKTKFCGLTGVQKNHWFTHIKLGKKRYRVAFVYYYIGPISQMLFVVPKCPVVHRDPIALANDCIALMVTSMWATRVARCKNNYFVAMCCQALG